MKRPRFALLAFVGTFLGLCCLGLPPAQKGSAADPGSSASQARPTVYGYDEYGYEDYTYEDVSATQPNQDEQPVAAPDSTNVVVSEETADAIAPCIDPTVDDLTACGQDDEEACDLCNQNHWLGNCSHGVIDCCEELLYDCADDRLTRDLADVRMLQVLADDRHSYGNEEAYDINLEQEGLAPAPNESSESHAQAEAVHTCPTAEEAARAALSDHGPLECEHGSTLDVSDAQYGQWLDRGILPYELPTSQCDAPSAAHLGNFDPEHCDLEHLHYPTGKNSLGNSESPQASGPLVENNHILNDAMLYLRDVGRLALQWTNWLESRARERTALPPVSAPRNDASDNDDWGNETLYDADTGL